MELYELNKQIVSHTLLPLNIFCGEELGIMDIYIKKFVEATGVTAIRLDTVQEVYNKVTQKRIVGGARCFIVRDDKEFLKQEKSWVKVMMQLQTSKDFVILIYTSMDKRIKFYKTYLKDFVEFEKLPVEKLIKYVEQQLPEVDTRDIIKLIEICECNYNRILLECDKIKQYSNAVNIKQHLSLKKLLETETIYQPIGDITFKFTDAIALRDHFNTAEYLLQAKRKQEPEILVLSVLYNTFKHILLVQGLGENQDNAVQRTGLTAWQVSMAKQKQKHYSIHELVNALLIIREAEKGIKTGQLDIDIAIEYVIVNLMMITY